MLRRLRKSPKSLPMRLTNLSSLMRPKKRMTKKNLPLTAKVPVAAKRQKKQSRKKEEKSLAEAQKEMQKLRVMAAIHNLIT